jgi:hypothetical protein
MSGDYGASRAQAGTGYGGAVGDYGAPIVPTGARMIVGEYGQHQIVAQIEPAHEAEPAAKIMEPATFEKINKLYGRACLSLHKGAYAEARGAILSGQTDFTVLHLFPFLMYAACSPHGARLSFGSKQ